VKKERAMSSPPQFSAAFGAFVVQLRCPKCRANGAFHGVPGINDAGFHRVVVQPNGTRAANLFKYGIRLCPNPVCGEPLFVQFDSANKLLKSYPAELLDFEPSGVPEKILESFEEALTCHANACFKAAAIMVRRTLEEICGNRNAEGKDLKARISSLGSKITVPKELLEAADELRILGNDAAHLEGKIYDDVGKEEVEVAIDLCKELLKAVFQLSSLVDRLRALKKP
jgi:hypothetical protein